MPSSDTLGYPIKKHFWRTGLEIAWLSAFKALDKGAIDGKPISFEDFLKEAADRTYPDALHQIELNGTKSESRYIQEAKGEVEKGGIEQYQTVAENLRQSGDEYHASAIDALIAELVAERAKPKRAARAKPTPKPKSLETFVPPIHPQSFTPTEKEANPTDYIAKLCKQSPMSHTNILRLVKSIPPPDIEVAIKIVKECNTLDDFDRLEIETLLQEKAMGIVAPRLPTEPELHKMLSPVAKPREKPKTKLRTMRDVSGKREEEVLPFQKVEYEYHSINLQNARLFWRDYIQYIPEMLRMGLQAWLEAHRAVFKFPLTVSNIEALSRALEYAIIPSKASIREMTANEFMQRYAYLVITQGLEPASKSFDWQEKYDYYKGTLKEKLPDISTFRRDVLEEMRKIKVEF